MGGRFARVQLGDVGLGAALGAHAAADKHATEKDHHRHDRGGHEEEHQLFPIQLDLVGAVVLSMSSQT